MPTTISDAAVAAIQGYANQIISEANAALTLLAPTGTVWSRVGVVNNPTYSNGDLTVAATGIHLIRATASFHASNRYAEVNINQVGNSGYLGIGIIDDTQSLASPPASLAAVPSGLWVWRSDGWIAHNSTNSQSASSFASGDNLGILLTDTGEVHVQKNGTWASAPLFTGVIGGSYTMALAFFGANGSPIATGQFASPAHTPSGASLYQ